MANTTKLLTAKLQYAKGGPPETDYSKWERKPKKINKERRYKVGDSKAATSASESMGQSVAPAAEHHSCSTLCNHGKPKKQVMLPKRNFPLRRTERRLVLKMQIAAVEKSIKECQQHFLYLARENMKLKEEIMSREKSTNTDVSSLLENYQKFRGNMAVIKRKHTERVEEATKELNDVQAKITEELARVTLDCEDIVRRVDEKNKMIKKLHTYKEKEYPEKVLQIGKLKREIQLLEQSHKDEMQEMTSIMEVEERKYKDAANVRHSDVLVTTAKGAVNSLSDTDMEIAIQNSLMRKELSIHQNEISILEYEIEELQTKIRGLKEARRERKQFRISPWPKEICTPDMELVLNIPRKESLPI